MSRDRQKVDEREIFTARNLIDALQDWGIMDPNAKDATVDIDGERYCTRVILFESTLTDGSRVFTVRLCN